MTTKPALSRNTKPSLPACKQAAQLPARTQARTRKRPASIAPFRLRPFGQEHEPPLRNAELFYLQKQIQAQTPMVIVLDDGEVLEGCIEWYDHNVLKIRGRSKTMVYKSAIKYMYKLGDTGQ
jgi:sRNA-binding regulator protein Hfq